MTLEDVYEWLYRYHERVGIMCENRIPTPFIRSTAEREATEALPQAVQKTDLAFDF